MRRTITRSTVVALAALGLVAAGCGGDKSGGAPAGSAAPATTDAVNASAATTAVAAPPSAAVAASTATPGSSAAATAPSAAPSSGAAAGGSSATAPAGTGSAAGGAKTYDCGAKGQKPCPMQGWMKGVMGGASSSGDGEKLASALSTVASHSPPGFGGWSAIASAGAAKAKAGDIDGAKATCKQCHDQFKEKYKASLRDRPWP